jgi:hypothetical protein
LTAARLGTFDAERWWRPTDLAELPSMASGSAAEAMDELLAGFCEPGDLLLTRHPIAPEIRDGLAACGIGFDNHALAGEGTVESLALRDFHAVELVAGRDRLDPYAVLPDTVALAERLQWADQLPPLNAVVEANSKTWSNALVQRLGLPGAGKVVRSVEELAEAVDGPSVVKDPFGVSGRATLEVGAPGVLRAITRTLSRQGKRVELIVQPKYDKVADFSGHVEIGRDGSWRILGVQSMHNRGFRHIGSGPPSEELLASLDGYQEVLAEVAKALIGVGYWGPAGVDSMLLADGTLVPILEINARRSLGLLCMVLGARVGLPCRLWQVEVKVCAGKGIGTLASALRRAGALYDGGSRPGVVLLSGSALAAPGGRVYCALVCKSGAVARVQDQLLTAAVDAGMTPRGVVDAA